jgi:hypothetical protein
MGRRSQGQTCGPPPFGLIRCNICKYNPNLFHQFWQCPYAIVQWLECGQVLAWYTRFGGPTNIFNFFSKFGHGLSLCFCRLPHGSLPFDHIFLCHVISMSSLYITVPHHHSMPPYELPCGTILLVHGSV